MARIDRPDEILKKTLQLASVIGREFTRRLLDRIADDLRPQTDGVLPGTEGDRADIREGAVSGARVHVQARPHPRGSLQLAPHPAPEGAPPPDRLGDRGALRRPAPEHYEILAHHFGKAEAWDKALGYLFKAAGKAARAFATREAIALYDRAEEMMTIHRARADLYVLVSDFERAHSEGERVLALARQLGDREPPGGGPSRDERGLVPGATSSIRRSRRPARRSRSSSPPALRRSSLAVTSRRRSSTR
jgi:hypothetical protein